MRATALCALVGLAGCAHQGTEWSPRHPEQEFPPVVEVATRVGSPSEACDAAERTTLGVARAWGWYEVVNAVATVAAEHGGTHYTIEGDSTESEYVTHGSPMSVAGQRTRREDTRRVWAVVYRCR